jgi:general secretion pathway protein A
MFTHLYGLQTTPFTRNLNTGDILATTSVKELQARLALTVRERGIAVVTGEVGSGKSTAVRAFLASLDPNRHTLVTLTWPIPSPSTLYRRPPSRRQNQPAAHRLRRRLRRRRISLGRHQD